MNTFDLCRQFIDMELQRQGEKDIRQNLNKENFCCMSQIFICY